jgi:hypothetical protein
MKQQTVTLKIVYDELQNDAPSEWNWPMLLDIGGAESVEVIDANPVESAPESETNEDENE